MALGRDYGGQKHCSLARGLELLGERWTMLIVRDAFYGVRRYSDFLARLDLPRAVLAERLTTLTGAGVLEKRRYNDAPVREEYVLTARGRALWPVLASIIAWSTEHVMDGAAHRRHLHAPCGETLAGAHCPSCGPVPPEEVEIRPSGADDERSDPVTALLREPKPLLTPLRG